MGKRLVLLSLWIDFIVLDEVDDGGASVGVKSKNLLPYGRDQVGLCRRLLFHLDHRVVECLNEHAGWYDGPLGSELGQCVSRDVVVPGDMVELQTIKLGFELPDLPAVGIHLLLDALPIFIHLLYDDFGVAISQQALDAEFNSDPETVDESFILSSVVGSLEK